MPRGSAASALVVGGATSSRRSLLCIGTPRWASAMGPCGARPSPPNGNGLIWSGFEWLSVWPELQGVVAEGDGARERAPQHSPGRARTQGICTATSTVPWRRFTPKRSTRWRSTTTCCAWSWSGRRRRRRMPTRSCRSAGPLPEGDGPWGGCDTALRTRSRSRCGTVRMHITSGRYRWCPCATPSVPAAPRLHWPQPRLVRGQAGVAMAKPKTHGAHALRPRRPSRSVPPARRSWTRSSGGSRRTWRRKREP